MNSVKNMTENELRTWIEKEDLVGKAYADKAREELKRRGKL